jgi:hypothetical protein
MCRSCCFVRYRTDEWLRRIHSGGDGLFRFRGRVLRSGGTSRAAKCGVIGRATTGAIEARDEYDHIRDSTTHQTCKWRHVEAGANAGKVRTEFCETGAEPIKVNPRGEIGTRCIQTEHRPEFV